MKRLLTLATLLILITSCKSSSPESNSVTNTNANTAPNVSTEPALAPNISYKPFLPNSNLTPGDTLDVTKDDICVSGYSRKVRNVPQAVKEQAYKEYDITSRQPREYEVDHLISLELGGSNSIKNLWPESYLTEPWNAHVKDELENKLHEMICNGQIDIKAAQHEISTDWIAAYKKYIGPEPKPTEKTSSTTLARENSHRGADLTTDKPGGEKPTGAPSANSSGTIIGNKRSHIYHKPGCPDYDKVLVQNRVMFQSVTEAEKAGYHAAQNCP